MRALWLLLLLATPVLAAETDAESGLIVAPGWQHVRAHCGACHSYALVTSQRADRRTWLAMIRWMQATQNLWPLAAEVENEILDYLSEHYPPQPNRRRAPLSPSLLPPRAGVQ